MESKLKNIIFILASLVISIVLGVICKDYFWGTLTVFFGTLNAYLMAIGRWENYIFGILFTITYAYSCTINGLYGWLIFSIIFYLPVQIFGVINWIRNKKEKEVETKSFTVKNSIIICSSIIIGSLILGFLLSLIPNQNLAFLDSSSQIINISGVILLALRFKECWYVWLANNIIDLSIWLVNAIKGASNSYMALIVSFVYFIFNIVGFVYWIKIEKKQRKNA